MRRLADIALAVWRCSAIASPEVEQAQRPAPFEARRRSGTGSDLQLPLAAPMPGDAPGRHPPCNADHPEVAIEEHDVDREAHPDRVDAAQRIREEQTAPGIETGPAQQPTCRRPPERPGDVDAGHHDRPRIRIDQRVHAASMAAAGHTADAPNAARRERSATRRAPTRTA